MFYPFFNVIVSSGGLRHGWLTPNCWNIDEKEEDPFLNVMVYH